MKLFALFAFGLLAGWLIAQSPTSSAEPRRANAVAFAREAKKANPQAFTHLFANGSQSSVYVATPMEPIRAHYHAEHDEAVVVVRGTGKLTVGGRTSAYRPGDVVFIPKGVVHSCLPEVDDQVLVSFFGPSFDGKDRVFVGR